MVDEPHLYAEQCVWNKRVETKGGLVYHVTSYKMVASVQIPEFVAVAMEISVTVSAFRRIPREHSPSGHHFQQVKVTNGGRWF